MQTLRIYLYHQILKLQFREGGLLTTEDRTVYAKPLTIYKGIDNPIKVVVKNQDQKTVDLTGLTVYVEMLTRPGGDYIGTFTAEATATDDRTKGRLTITVPASLINPIVAGWYHFLVKYVDGSGNNLPAYNDDNYGIAIPVYLHEGYRVEGNVYDREEDNNLGSIPELVNEVRDLGAL